MFTFYSHQTKLYTPFLTSFFLPGNGAAIPIFLPSKGLMIFPRIYSSVPIKRGGIHTWDINAISKAFIQSSQSSVSIKYRSKSINLTAGEWGSEMGKLRPEKRNLRQRRI